MDEGSARLPYAYRMLFPARCMLVTARWHGDNCGISVQQHLPPCCCLQAWLRVALGYHTVAQVAVGWVVGGGSAAAWHAWGRRVALPAAQQSPQLQVSRE